MNRECCASRNRGNYSRSGHMRRDPRRIYNPLKCLKRMAPYRIFGSQNCCQMGSRAILRDQKLCTGILKRNSCFQNSIMLDRVEEGKFSNFFLILIQEHKAMRENYTWHTSRRCSGFKSGAWKWKWLLLQTYLLPFVTEWHMILHKMLSLINVTGENVSRQVSPP